MGLTEIDTKFDLSLIDEVKDKIVYADLLWVDLRNDKHLCHFCDEKIAFTHNFHGITVDQKAKESLCLYLNSSISCFFIEVLGRGNLGEGAIRILAQDLSNHFPALIEFKKIEINGFLKRKQRDIFTELGFDRTQLIRSQKPNPLPDRKALDKVIFDELGLTEEERREVYWATAELVKQRLDKAGSRK